MKTVVDGVLAKGMPNWGKMLKPDQVEGVVGYVQTLIGTNPANPKAPEGAKYPADSAAVPAAAPQTKGM